MKLIGNRGKRQQIKKNADKNESRKDKGKAAEDVARCYSRRIVAIAECDTEVALFAAGFAL